VGKLKRKIKELEKLKDALVNAEHAYYAATASQARQRQRQHEADLEAIRQGNYDTSRSLWIWEPEDPNIARYESLEEKIENLESEIAVLEDEEREAGQKSQIEIEKIRAEEAQAQRDHELQMAIIQRDTALAQAEASRLAAEANAKAQEQASSSLDALISGVTGNGATKDRQ
tara:strand:- start:180 stop:695 length:516 start_codon:yes stop_codon:yes gene_type:complete